MNETQQKQIHETTETEREGKAIAIAKKYKTTLN